MSQPYTVFIPIFMFLFIASTFTARQTIKEFDKEAFPRFKQTQQRIQSIVSRITGLIDKVAVNWKWTYRMDNPLIVLRYRKEPKYIDWTKLSVQVSDIRETRLEMQNISDNSLPVILICVIQTHSLRSRFERYDFSMMNDIFDLTNETLDNVLFAIDLPEDSLTTTTFDDLSYLIAAELKLDSKDICHRLFGLHDNNIGIRASLYLERQMLNRYRTIKSQLQRTFERIEKLVIDLKSPSYFDNYGKCLEEGPFYDSLQYMINVAKEYPWVDIDTTRNKWTVDRVKENITNHICKSLGNIISKSLIQKLKSDFKAADLDISHFLYDNTDISGIRQAIYEFTVRYIVERILKGVKAVVTVVITFLFTENLNSTSFRDKIAHTVHEQITENKEGLIWSILAKFKDLQLPILQEIKGSLFEILIQTADPLECRTEMDCYYHELKIVASRNEHIQAIGYDGGHFCVYLHNSELKAQEIKNYLSKNLMNASQVEIREFRNMIVEEYSSLQSGDRIVLDVSKKSYGTLGFIIKDENDIWCATCRHVIEKHEAHKIHVRLLDGSINKAIEKHEPSTILDFAILKLETTSGSLPICTGLRNRNNEFVPGQVFMKDEFTLNPETLVYKWGSTTNLTTGIYKETYEKLKHTEESYPSIIIRNEANGSFGEPGDSGSLVCFTGHNSEVAACLLMGHDNLCPGTFPGHRIADGLSLIKNKVPNINHLFTNEILNDNIND